MDRQVLCYPWLDFGLDSESHRLFDDVLVSSTDDAWFEAQYLAGQAVTLYVAPLTAPPDLAGLPSALVLSIRFATTPGDTLNG